MTAFERIRAGSVRGLYWIAPLTVSLSLVCALAQSANILPSATAMKTFVIIFRQGPRQLTESDKQRRAEETIAWARAQNMAGGQHYSRNFSSSKEDMGASVF